MSRPESELERRKITAANSPASENVGGKTDEGMECDADIEMGKRYDPRTRLLLETLPIGVLNCDRDGVIEYFNPAAVALWGRAPLLRDPQQRYCGSLRMFTVAGELVLAK